MNLHFSTQDIIVHPSMSCEDVRMIELAIKVKVVNRDCSREDNIDTLVESVAEGEGGGGYK